MRADVVSLPVAEYPAAASHRRLRVGVLVDLSLTPHSGGHVKCWERLAQAALQFPEQLDLTVHFAGERREVRILGDNVRYHLEPPVFSTARLPFLSHVPDHTDLALHHPRLAPLLAGYDVIHTTDAYFAYARTARRVAQAEGIPLVSSVHTNTPEYARIYTEKTVRRLCGSRSFVARLLLDQLDVAGRAERRMERRLTSHHRCCAFVLVSRGDQLAAAQEATHGHAAMLRRGIDRQLFNPARRDRRWLQWSFGIAPDRVAVLFVGRLSDAKNVPLLVEAMAQLVERGVPAHLICAGEGEQRAAIERRLGPRATCTGSLAPEILARLYASVDLFAFPSAIEESANVVKEALSSGLPTLVAGAAGMGSQVSDGVTGFALPADDPGAWAKAIALLAGDEVRRTRMGRLARTDAETRFPSWADVLAEDLLPRWQQVASAWSQR